jgi:hypothetical protein
LSPKDILAKDPYRFFKNPVFVLVIILFAAIGFRVYKAHYTGIINDEAWTQMVFSKNLHTALTSYDSTNNHVLNSIFIVLTQKVFGSYEHFIRIPAVLFGALFCCAMTYIIHKTIRYSILKIVLLLLILMNWWIVDLTYLARGYAIALGAVFTGIAILIRLSSGRGKKVWTSWWVVIFLIAMNFTAIGAMISSLPIVLSINFAFVLLMISGTEKPKKRILMNAAGRVVAVGLASAISLLLLYRHVFSDMMARGKIAFEVEPFFEYLKKVLWSPLIYNGISRAKSIEQVYNVVLILSAVCATICLFVFLYRLKTNRGNFPHILSPAVLIFLLSSGVLFLMFVQCAVFNVSLGMPRNGVFLLPLIMLSCGIVMDRAVRSLSRVKILSVLMLAVCVVLPAVLCYQNLPSCRTVNIRPYDWSKQSVIGPLARTLKSIDSDKRWSIKLSPYADCLQRSIKYYTKFGFKIKQTKKDNFDIIVVREHKPDGRYVYLEKERFAEHRCNIIVNPKSPLYKTILNPMHD